MWQNASSGRGGEEREHGVTGCVTLLHVFRRNEDEEGIGRSCTSETPRWTNRPCQHEAKETAVKDLVPEAILTGAVPYLRFHHADFLWGLSCRLVSHYA